MKTLILVIVLPALVRSASCRAAPVPLIGAGVASSIAIDGPLFERQVLRRMKKLRSKLFGFPIPNALRAALERPRCLRLDKGAKASDLQTV
jgi:hypothetical protein